MKQTAWEQSDWTYFFLFFAKRTARGTETRFGPELALRRGAGPKSPRPDPASPPASSSGRERRERSARCAGVGVRRGYFSGPLAMNRGDTRPRLRSYFTTSAPLWRSTYLRTGPGAVRFRRSSRAKLRTELEMGPGSSSPSSAETRRCTPPLYRRNVKRSLAFGSVLGLCRVPFLL